MIDEHGFEALDDDAHLAVERDVYSPCARGAGINDDTIPRLRCKIFAGAANDQPLEPRHAQALRERGILSAPDYAINAGGIVNVGAALLPGGYDEAATIARVEMIHEDLKQVFEISRLEDIPTNGAAARLAERRLEAARAG